MKRSAMISKFPRQRLTLPLLYTICLRHLPRDLWNCYRIGLTKLDEGNLGMHIRHDRIGSKPSCSLYFEIRGSDWFESFYKKKQHFRDYGLVGNHIRNASCSCRSLSAPFIQCCFRYVPIITKLIYDTVGTFCFLPYYCLPCGSLCNLTIVPCG